MHVGDRLRQAREARGLTIGAIARLTRVPAAALTAIERNDLAALPPHPYNKGFVEAYAREIGLDAHQTGREFLDQFEPAAAPMPAGHDEVPPHDVIEGRPRRLIWLAVPAVALLLFMFVGRPPPTGAVPERETAPASVTDVAPAAAVRSGSAAESDPVPGPTTAPAAHAQAISVVLVATGPAWVEAHADGLRVLYGLLEPGAEQRLSADRELTLRIGDARAVSLTVNGRGVGILGAAGVVRTLRMTPETVETIR